jgi:CheY-like chemotaxis protein
VLLADDERIVRTVASRMLRRCGLDVLEAQDGEEALELFRAHKDAIVCVLLDFNMPRMNGEETIAAMRRMRPDLPALLSSGYSEEQAAKRFGGRGISAFLQKPYLLDALTEALSRIL